MADPATDAKNLQALLDGQKQILSMINDDAQLSDVLRAICLLLEAQMEGTMVSVLLLDADGQRLRHGAAPSLPDEYNEAVDGLAIGPKVGSCGAAAHSGKECVVSDISTHPNWAFIRDFAYVKHGLRSCWSTPIRAYDGAVLGTFALYSREVREPTLVARKLVDFTSHLVTLVVNRHREQEQLQLLYSA